MVKYVIILIKYHEIICNCVINLIDLGRLVMYSTIDKNIVDKLIRSDKIATINVINLMENEKDFKILVDDLSNPKGFILKCNDLYIPYSTDDKIAFEMIKSLNYKKGDIFGGILKKYYDFIIKSYEIDWEEHCFLYYMDKESLKNSKCSYKVEKLRIEDAEIVNEFFTYKDDTSIEYIRERITFGLSSAVFDDYGNPISWAMVREDGSMGIMFTKKEHRGKGIAASVSIDLAKKVINNNKTPYVHIINNNTASVALAESIGFKKYGDVVWFGVK